MLQRSLSALLHVCMFGTFCLVLLAARVASASTTIAGGNIINQTWTVAGSPYIVQGDVTIPNGAFLTIQPGVDVHFASTDAQAGGIDASRVELTVEGTLTAIGTVAAPITFKAQSAASASVWYGIVVDAAATAATIDQAVIESAHVSVGSAAGGTALTVSHTSVSLCDIGVSLYGNGGSPVLDGLTISGAARGVFIYSTLGTTSIRNSIIEGNTNSGVHVSVSNSANTSVDIVNSVIRSNGSFGVMGNAGVFSTLNLKLTNSTLHANGSVGIGYWSSGNSLTSVTVKNSIVTQHSSSGAALANQGGTLGSHNLTISYSNFWNNGSVISCTGCVSQNPLYTSAPTNLTLQMGSVCIDSGTPAGAPSTDLVGAPRPIDGDGINAAEFDMGAYEYSADPCAGVTCNSPPSACHATLGSCSEGTCSYALKPAGAACDDQALCTEIDVCSATGQCAGQPVVCNTPPEPSCIPVDTSHAYAVAGECEITTGQCGYTVTDTVCESGCDSATGLCSGDPCADVVCNSPPSACHLDNGRCDDAECAYGPKPSGVFCDDGDLCTLGETCDGNGVCASGAPDPTCGGEGGAGGGAGGGAEQGGAADGGDGTGGATGGGGSDDESGCNCRMSGGGDGRSALWLLAAVVAVVLRRRRR